MDHAMRSEGHDLQLIYDRLRDFGERTGYYPTYIRIDLDTFCAYRALILQDETGPHVLFEGQRVDVIAVDVGYTYFAYGRTPGTNIQEQRSR